MPASKLKRPYKLGVYPLGYEWVDVWVLPGEYGGYFDSPFEKGSLQKMGIGIADPSYGHALAVALHETIESVACDLGVRYRKSGTFIETASDAVHFQMNHNEFSEVCARTGAFISHVQLDLMKAHQKIHGKR